MDLVRASLVSHCAYRANFRPWRGYNLHLELGRSPPVCGSGRFHLVGVISRASADKRGVMEECRGTGQEEYMPLGR